MEYNIEEDIQVQPFSTKQLVLPEDFQISKTEDCIISDDKGNDYIDFTSNQDNNSLGYNNKQVHEIILKNINIPLQQPSGVKTEALTNFSEALTEITHMGNVFVSDSKLEANNVVLKLLSLWLKYELPQKETYEFLSLKGKGSLNFIDKFKIKNNNLNIQDDHCISFDLVSRNYFQPSILKTIFSKNVAAIVIDPFKVIEGTFMIDHEITQVAYDLCERSNALLILDMTEISPGRIGEILPVTHIQPDIITMSKGLGQSFPIGITITSSKLSNITSKYYTHNSSYSPLVIQIANFYLKILEDSNIMDEIKIKGDCLFNKINELKDKYLNILEITHKGLLLCVEMDFELSELISKCLEDGIILESYGSNSILIRPPFSVTLEQIDHLLHILDKHLNTLKSDYRMQ